MGGQALGQDSLVSFKLGHYRIVEKIGTGGMGDVYRAHDEHLARDVAIKVLPPGTLIDESARKHFHKEALILSKLNHPNVATIHDFDTQQGVDFLVMEYIPGITLRDKVAAGPLPGKEVLRLGVQLAEGLCAAHEHGVIHRDLKPGNLRVTDDGRLKILDFGLAKLRLPPTASATTESRETQSMAGTLPYMAPEQLLGENIDTRTDIHQAGAALYEMATGQRPFFEVERSQLIGAILRRSPLPPTALNPRLSSELERVIMKCLEKEPENRYQSALDLRVDLQRLLMPSPVISVMAPPRWRHRRKGVASIGILPLVNTSADPDTEHLSNGITENVINSLSHLPKLRVMARSTVFRYKGREVDPITVGRELNVDAVLIGQLVQRGDSLNIATELVDVSDGAQIWGEQYSRKLADIFSVQEEIATEISSRLRLKLTGKEKKQIAKRYTENHKAYQAYLRGRYMASKYTENGTKKAIEYFRQAIEIDPTFALAYAGLAMAYWNVSAVQFAPTEVMPKARAASQRAVEIDPELAESHAAVALVKMAYEWDRPGAEREFKRATQLNPGYATMYQWHGWHLAIMGRLEESCVELERARELDPLSEIDTYIGLSHYWARQYDLAIEHFRKTLELYADFWLSHLYLGWTYFQQGLITPGFAELTEAFRLENNPWTVASLAHAWAVSGDLVRAQQLLADLQQRASCQFVSPYFVARTFTGLRDKEQAFAWLEKAYDARDECLTWLKVDPTMDDLHADTRYPDLLRRLGLPP